MFDTKSFMSTELMYKQEDVKVEELIAWFDNTDPVFTVRGLSHKEIAIAEEQSTSNQIDALVKAVSGTNNEQAEAIRKIIGLDNEMPKDTKKRIELLSMGSVDPKITLDLAIKISTNYPTVFVQLTNKILQLTGLGSDVLVKPSASGKD